MDTYLVSLVQAVLFQQTEAPINVVEEVTNEEIFGAHKSFSNSQEDKGKINYYAITHRTKENVTKQASLLISGTLKYYKVKGLPRVLAKPFKPCLSSHSSLRQRSKRVPTSSFFHCLQ